MPILLGERLAIKGSWDTKAAPDGRLEIKLVPQENRFAFGNGYKRSTRLMLSELEAHIKPINGFRILDIGTGVGTLSIAAKKLNPNAIVTAIEPLDTGIYYAKQNFVVNDVDISLLQGWYPDDFRGNSIPQQDLILGNLDTLEPIAAAMNTHLAPKIIVFPKTDDVDVVQAIADLRGYRLSENINDDKFEYIVLERV